MDRKEDLEIPDYANSVLEEIAFRNIEKIIAIIKSRPEVFGESVGHALQSLRDNKVLTKYNTLATQPEMAPWLRLQVVNFNCTNLLDPEYLKIPNTWA